LVSVCAKGDRFFPYIGHLHYSAAVQESVGMILIGSGMGRCTFCRSSQMGSSPPLNWCHNLENGQARYMAGSMRGLPKPVLLFLFLVPCFAFAGVSQNAIKGADHVAKTSKRWNPIDEIMLRSRMHRGSIRHLLCFRAPCPRQDTDFRAMVHKMYFGSKAQGGKSSR